MVILGGIGDVGHASMDQIVSYSSDEVTYLPSMSVNSLEQWMMH